MVKVSTEDLSYLLLGKTVGDAVAALLGAGCASVLVTDGTGTVRAFCGGTEIRVGAPPVEVADTVGAGDALGGAFLAWWVGNGLTRADLRQPEAVRSAVQAAVEVAVLTCARSGAEPPWAGELAGHQGWDWLPDRGQPPRV